MKYLCLAYGTGPLSPGEREDLIRMGRLTLLASLAPARSCTTLRPVNGRAELFDGPYDGAHEPAEAFFILEARDLNEAIQAASRHPAARAGGKAGSAVEIRPIDLFEATGAVRA